MKISFCVERVLVHVQTEFPLNRDFIGGIPWKNCIRCLINCVEISNISAFEDHDDMHIQCDLFLLNTSGRVSTLALILATTTPPPHDIFFQIFKFNFLYHGSFLAFFKNVTLSETLLLSI